MQIYLGGYLSFFSAGQSWVEVPVPHPARLSDILTGLNIPSGEVYLTVVNGQMAQPADVIVTDQDQVKLYPPIDGG